MTSLLNAHPRGSVENSDNLAGSGVQKCVVKASAGERPGDDLLRHLPSDRLSSGSALLVEAVYTIAGDQVERFARSSAALGGSSDELFLAVFATLLARLTGQEVVTLATAFHGPAVCKLALTPEMSFRALHAAVISGRPLAFEPCAIEFVAGDSPASAAGLLNHTLRMTIEHSGSEMRVGLVSSTGLWNQAILELWLRYFDGVLRAASATPDFPWKTLPLLNPAEAFAFYRTFNNTESAYPDLVPELVARQVERTPDAIAVASELRRYTYRQLQEHSDAIANRLRALGADRDRPVAVCLERSAELPVALLGVLKSGSSYVPLDPREAPRRLLTILEECQPIALIADRHNPSLNGVNTIATLFLDGKDDKPNGAGALNYSLPAIQADQQAYTIYTSGTTGRPKGVAITHGALANFLTFFLREPSLAAGDCMLAVSPISFDIATLDMFLPLIAGATLVVADRFVAADPFRLAAMIQEFQITVLQATPATWRLLQSSGWEGKSSLKMISGGEALPRDLANELLHLGGELWNCYGPTETTIYSSVQRIHSESGIVPIGPPIANTTFYVLDETGRLLPPGVPGELYIGGAGVSPGYLNRLEITKERFLSDSYSSLPGARMFKSGDLVRLINGSEFEFFGRLDHQVKLRGYRIELGEIESALRTFPGVENAVAALRGTGQTEPYLVAYYTTGHEQPDLLQLRDHLAQRLPAYMMPSQFVMIDSMPLTSSGKIDRNALLASDAAGTGLSAHRQVESIDPQTKLEEKLLIIFRDVLARTEFGVTDSFFDYGGYSLLAVKLFTRIRRTLGLDLPISLLFDAPTVRALAEMIERAQSPSTIVPIRPLGASPPLFVIHSYLLYGVLPQIVEHDRPVYGLRESMAEPHLQTFEDLAAGYVHEILHAYPNGPVMLSGWCAAGSLTVEIARQFRELGRNVGLVALFDAERPDYRPVVRGRRVARLLARLRFHLDRLRDARGRERLPYIGNALRHSWNQVFELLFTRHPGAMLRLKKIFGFSLPDAVFNNEWTRFAAVHNHVQANYSGRVILFRALDVPQLPDIDQDLGWKEVVDQDVEVVFVPGDHESMFRDPHVGVLRERLRQALQLAV